MALSRPYSLFGNPDAIAWEANRANRAHIVHDEGVMDVTQIQTHEAISAPGRKCMRIPMFKRPDTALVVFCHVEVGHKGLRSMLNYYKPEYDFYKGKFDKKKEEVEKKLTEELKK